MTSPSEADKDFALAILNRIDGPDDLVETLSDETGGYVFSARGRTAQFWPSKYSRFGGPHWQAYQALLDMADIAFYARPDDKWTHWQSGAKVAIFLNDRTGAVELRKRDGGEVIYHEDGPEDYYPGSVRLDSLVYDAMRNWTQGSKP